MVQLKVESFKEQGLMCFKAILGTGSCSISNAVDLFNHNKYKRVGLALRVRESAFAGQQVVVVGDDAGIRSCIKGFLELQSRIRVTNTLF